MSDDNKKDEGSSTTKDEGQKVDVNEVLKRLEELQGSYERAVKESKSYKEKLNEEKSRAAKAEEEKIKASGDLAQQLEYERKQREEVERKAKTIASQTLQQKLREAAKRFAPDAHDIEDLLNQPKHKAILQAGIDAENLTVDENAVKNYVNAVLSEKPWLKKNLEQASVDSKKPNANGSQKNLKSLSDSELDSIIGL